MFYIRDHHPASDMDYERDDDGNVIIPVDDPHITTIVRTQNSSDTLCGISILSWICNISSFIITSNPIQCVNGIFSIIGFCGAYRYSLCSLNIFSVYQYASLMVKTYDMLIINPNYTGILVIFYCIDMLFNIMIISLVTSLKKDIKTLREAYENHV